MRDKEIETGIFGNKGPHGPEPSSKAKGCDGPSSSNKKVEDVVSEAIKIFDTFDSIYDENEAFQMLYNKIREVRFGRIASIEEEINDLRKRADALRELNDAL